MGGINPMPTIAEKGQIFMAIDDYYINPVNRLKTLLALRAISAIGTGKGDGVSTIQGIISADQGLHILSEWFGAQNAAPHDQGSWFRTINMPTTTVGSGATAKQKYNPTGKGTLGTLGRLALDEAANQIREAMIVALEVSLGLAGGGAADGLALTADQNALNVQPVRNLPLDIYWICGKANGFETIVSWNLRQVTVLITTPPTFWAACPVEEATTLTVPAAKQNPNVTRGMIVVRSNNNTVTRQLLSTGSGGVND